MYRLVFLVIKSLSKVNKLLPFPDSEHLIISSQVFTQLFVERPSVPTKPLPACSDARVYQMNTSSCAYFAVNWMEVFQNRTPITVGRMNRCEQSNMEVNQKQCLIYFIDPVFLTSFSFVRSTVDETKHCKHNNKPDEEDTLVGIASLANGREKKPGRFYPWVDMPWRSIEISLDKPRTFQYWEIECQIWNWDQCNKRCHSLGIEKELAGYII